MRIHIPCLVGTAICLWLFLPGCGDGEQGNSIETPDSGTGDSAGSGGKPVVDSGPGEDVLETGGEEEPDGPYLCTGPKTARRKDGYMEYSCGLERCIPGIGCPGKCESVDDCVTPEDIEWDPEIVEIECEDLSHRCLPIRLIWNDPPYDD